MNGVARSVRLFQGFRREATDPRGFYRLLAEDTVGEVSRYCQLAGATVLDVGGASGYVGEAFRDAGAAAVTVEVETEQMTEHGRHLDLGIVGDGCTLPIADDAVDVTHSSNVLEHVAYPARMLSEMVRVVCPGGIAFLTFTNWYSPWGGHETSPWHLVGGEWAAARYRRRHGVQPKNRYGVSLFPLHVHEVLAWARACPRVDVLDAFPRYYPRWTRPVVAVPGLRELATWNLALVLRRRDHEERPSPAAGLAASSLASSLG